MNFEKIPTATLQQKRAAVVKGRVVMYEPTNVKAAIKEYEMKLKPFVPDKTFDGPLRVAIMWNFGTKDKKKQGTWKTSRPDADNMAKILLDRMTKLGFWEDDSQIVQLKCYKKWEADSTVKILIEEVRQ